MNYSKNGMNNKQNYKTNQLLIGLAILATFLVVVIVTPAILQRQKEKRLAVLLYEIINTNTKEGRKIIATEYIKLSAKPTLSLRSVGADDLTLEDVCAYMDRIVSYWERLAYSGRNTFIYYGGQGISLTSIEVYRIYDAVLVAYAETCMGMV